MIFFIPFVIVSLLACGFVGCLDLPNKSGGKNRNLGKGEGKGAAKGFGKAGGKGKCGLYSKHRALLQRYFDSRLSEGQNETILEDGSLLIFADCTESGTSLFVRLYWLEDLLVYGDISGDHGLDDAPLVNQTLPSGVLFEKALWTMSANSAGNDVNDGAVWVSTGHFIGYNGDSTIGIHRTNSSELAFSGDSVNCMISGVLQYVVPSSC